MKLTDYLTKRTDDEVRLRALHGYFLGTKLGMFGENAEHWTGPRLDIADPDYTNSLERIKQNYLVHNLLASVLTTHVSAVVGREIDWQLKPENAEASEALTTWYYRQRVQETLQDACRTMLWATREDDETTAIMRFSIPAKALDENGQTKADGLEPILEDAVRLYHPRPGTAGMLRDDDGEQIAGWYAYSVLNPDTKQIEGRLELVALDTTFAAQEWDRKDGAQTATGNTVIQILGGLDYAEIVDETNYPLDGNLTIFELSRRPLITEDVISQQNGLNTQWTYLNRHSSASAFLERVILNGMPPGMWIVDLGQPGTEGLPQRTTKDGVKQVYVRAPHVTGGGTTSYIGGLPLPDGGYTNPSVQFRELSSTEPLLANIKAHREAILELTNQQHRLIIGDSTASGVSRKTALQDFTASLTPTETQVKFAVAWLLKTALLLAGHFNGSNRSYLSTEVDAKVTLWAADPTPEEKRMVIELVKAGLLTTEEGMRQVGVQDTATALALVQAEADERHRRALELMQQRTPVASGEVGVTT